MRPRTLVAGAALTAALALVALPGLAGSATPAGRSPEAAAFRDVDLATVVGTRAAIRARSAASRLAPVRSFGRIGDEPSVVLWGEASAAPLDGADRFSDPGPIGRVDPVGRARAPQPASTQREEWAPAKYSLTGTATFYDNGTTAMRLPRGTVIRVCGPGGCLVRVVEDWGPRTASRIIDLYRPDFFSVCGCASWSGTTKVTVYVY